MFKKYILKFNKIFLTGSGKTCIVLKDGVYKVLLLKTQIW